MADPIISIGFLTESDLRRLGEEFTRCFPVSDTGLFDDLIEKLNQLPPTKPAHTVSTPDRDKID